MYACRKRKSMSLKLNVTPMGIPMAMLWEQVNVLLTIVNDFKVGLFVEIGLYRGGIESILIHRSRYCPEFHYLGVEIEEGSLDKRFVEVANSAPNTEIVIADCFSDHFLRRFHDTVSRCPAPLFILCDGGNKPKEFEFFQKYLRSGDLIASHDYLTEMTPEKLLDSTPPELYNEIEREEYRDKCTMPIFQRR